MTKDKHPQCIKNSCKSIRKGPQPKGIFSGKVGTETNSFPYGS